MADVNTPEIRVLSAGAPKTGVLGCARAFEDTHGGKIAVTFATAPVIRERVGTGAAGADVVIAPLPAMAAFEDEGRIVAGSAAEIGRVEAGVVVRDGAPVPDIATVESLVEACLQADSLVFNQASSGQRIAEMVARLGIAEEVAHKTTRVPTGRAVMERLAQGETEREIGFTQLTEIRVHADKGVKLVGPLPKGVEIVTAYAAGLMRGAASAEAARAFIAFMIGPAGRRILAEAGVA